jgi:hypothetical protein
VFAGLALSAAMIAGGIWWSRRPTATGKSWVGWLVAAGIAGVFLLTAEIYWERIINRYRGPNRPPPQWPLPAPPTDAQESLQ